MSNNLNQPTGLCGAPYMQTSCGSGMWQYTVADSTRCPSGWHLPTVAEFKTVLTYENASSDSSSIYQVFAYTPTPVYSGFNADTTNVTPGGNGPGSNTADYVAKDGGLLINLTTERGSFTSSATTGGIRCVKN